MKIWVNVCFHYVESRLPKFLELIKNLQEIPNIKIIINTNQIFDCDLPLNLAVLSDPYHLTWEHKKYMPEFLNSDYDYFVYVEGNMLLSKVQIDYWIQTNSLFRRNNLNFIPAFHRVQVDKDANVWSLDPTRKVPRVPTLESEGQQFISLPEPYQGMFMMDKPMVYEHLNSDYSKLGQKGYWGIRESANLGNMFVNVPTGYPHRAMIPLNRFPDTWIPHFGTDYHNDPKSPHAKILVTELFQ